MYIPKHFANNDPEDVLAFINKYSFGTIITAQDNMPFGTHVPFVAEMRDGEIVLSSHLAKANPHAQQLFDNEAMVIFTEPHAYISPQHYEKEQSVPTWNYIAVHAYGKATPVDDTEQFLGLMEKMIAQYEPAYFNQWAKLPMDFKTKMLNAIVGFEIRVTTLEAKNKLSQNRSEKERQNIIAAFENSVDVNEATIAAYMKG